MGGMPFFIRYSILYFHSTHSLDMPPKKKNKYANAAARGFATTSIPKAKPVVVEPEAEPELVAEPTPPPPEPVDQAAAAAAAEEEPEDEFVSLAERIESLSLRKVDAFLGQTQKINVDTLPVLKMEANLENTVVALLKEVEAKDAGKSLLNADEAWYNFVNWCIFVNQEYCCS